jgi:uncharacterized membrane protein YgdD (TMEM256/DUF423 family)
MSEHQHTSALRPLAASFITAGALLMLLAVILGAFGAHALQGSLAPRQLASYQTGVTYHLFHALALVVLGGLAQVTRPTPWISRAGLLLGAGIVLFSGSIYAMALGAPRWLGMVAPLGGISFMLGWIALALHVRASR